MLEQFGTDHYTAPNRAAAFMTRRTRASGVRQGSARASLGGAESEAVSS